MDRPAVRAALAVLVFVVALYVPLFGERDLWAPDEPKYTQAARETLLDGHWWHPHVNGGPYRDKPPLYFWSAAAVSAPFGDVTETTARIPPLSAGIVLILLVFDLGRRSTSTRAGSVAAMVTATTWLIAWMSRRVNLDVPLTLFVVAAVWCGYRAGERAREGARGSGAAWAAAAGVAAALGGMLKGPVVLLPIVAALGALAFHPAARRDRPRGFAAAGLAWAAVGAAAVLAAWLVPARILGGYDVISIANEHVVERASRGMHHVQPWWYYLKSVPADLLPWTFLAVPAAWVAWTRRRDPVDAFLLAWAVLPVVFLSLVVEKRNMYPLPSFPAFGLLIGRWVASIDERGVSDRVLRRVLPVLPVLVTVVATVTLVVAIFGGRVDELREYWSLPGLPARIGLLALLAVLGAGVAWSGLRRADAADRVRWAATGFALLELGVFLALPAVDPLKSAREIGAVVRREVGDRPLAMFPYKREGIVYYARHFVDELNDADDVRDWLAGHPEEIHVLTFRRFLSDLPEIPGRTPRKIASDPVGSRDAVLLVYPAAGASERGRDGGP